MKLQRMWGNDCKGQPIVGTMNEFSFLAEGYREYLETSDLITLSMRLSETPCSAIKHNSPARLLKEIFGDVVR